MSVLQCFRNSCNNVMCNRYSARYGYICNQCFEELVRLNPESIQAFMDSPKPNNQYSSDQTYRRFDQEFPDIDSLNSAF